MKINKNKSLLTLGVFTVLMSGFGFLFQKAEATSVMDNQKPTVEAKDNFGILLRKGNHLKVAVRTAQEIRENPRFNMGKFEVIVCGQEVEKLRAESELAKTLEEAARLGVKVKACGISLQKFGVEAESLDTHVEVVPNGLMRAFEMEKEGYLMTEL